MDTITAILSLESLQNNKIVMERLLNTSHRIWLYKMGLRETHSIFWFLTYGRSYDSFKKYR